MHKLISNKISMHKLHTQVHNTEGDEVIQPTLFLFKNMYMCINIFNPPTPQYPLTNLGISLKLSLVRQLTLEVFDNLPW